MFLKITAMGLTGDDGAYLADGWNWVDGTIVAFSAANVLIGLLSSSSDLGALRALRVARVLRPLRVIKRVPELRLVVTALLRSLPGISSVMVVSFFFWFIFGVIGVNLFRGAFYSCNDTSDAIVTKQDCQGAFVDDDGTVVERRWTNADQNFDNIGNALLTLFEISTTEGWIDVMFQGIDAAGKDLQPQRNAHPENAFYFVAFMLVASFLLVNMFVGIVLDSFGCVREEQQSITLLTPEQRDWMIAQIHIVGPLSIAPKHVRPKSHWRARIFDVVVHPRFDIFIAAAISVNTLFMLTQHYNQPNTWSNVLDTVDLCFTILYTAEMIAKIIALGFRGYIDSRWNQLDGTVVILGMLELAFNDIFQGSESTALRAVRVARVVRVLKTWKGLQVRHPLLPLPSLLRTSRRYGPPASYPASLGRQKRSELLVQAMFLTLFASLPTMANVGGVLLLTFWIYAVLGLNLFGKVTQNGEELNDNANFSNVGLSMLTLLRMATGEAWNTIMHEAMRSEPPYW